MTRLALRRGTVVSVERAGPATELTVEVAGEARPAVAYPDLTGPVEAGDDVVVNVAARDLGLGSGGFDLLHVNLTRGLEGTGEPGAHVMKLNYTSLQHAVQPVETTDLEAAPAGPVGVLGLHGQLAPVLWAAAEVAPGVRIGYVQTEGGALPGALSRVVAELRERGLLAGHITAGAAFGGEHEAITVAGALHAGLTRLGWDAAVAGPGPGIIGSATALGHGGLAALDVAHAALALGRRPVVVPRMSSGDPRVRHHGLSHHTTSLLDLLLRPALVALPAEPPTAVPSDAPVLEPAAPQLDTPAGHRSLERHTIRTVATDLEGYASSGLPGRTMGRDLHDDEAFFRAALAGGRLLGEEIDGLQADG